MKQDCLTISDFPHFKIHVNLEHKIIKSFQRLNIPEAVGNFECKILFLGGIKELLRIIKPS